MLPTLRWKAINQPVGDDLNITIRNLKAYTNYTVKIAGVTRTGIGIYSNPLIVITAETSKYMLCKYESYCYTVLRK